MQINAQTAFISASMVPSPAGAAGIAALALVVWIVCQASFAHTARLPGPWLTRLTRLVLVYHEYRGTKRAWIHGLHVRHGPVVRLGPSEASFASAAALKAIYVDSGGFDKTELYSLFEQEGERNVFTALEGDEHREKKKRLAAYYSNTHMVNGRMPELLQDRADAFVRRCAASPSVDVYFLLHCYALDCVSAVCFDPHGTHSIEGTDADMVQTMSYHDSRKSLVFQCYYPRLAALYRRLTAPRLKGSSRVRDYVWQSLAALDVAPTSLAARLRSFPADELSPGEQAAECLDHIGAGIDTTGDTLCFLLYELSREENAPLVARLRQELTSGSSSLLDAVISEALRLWAPSTMSLPRYVPAGGRVLDGYRLPAGTIVSCQSFTLHRLWADVFPEPEAFRPERWLAQDGLAERNRHLFAFGAGTRLCLGKNLAMAEMRTLVTSIYTCYRTHLAADMHYSMAMDDQFLTSRPRGMCCRLRFEEVQ